MSAHDAALPGHAIALVGMAGRFPGARDVETLWANMLACREGAQAIPEHQLDPAVTAETRSDPSYVAFRGVMPDYDRFDAAFFGVSPMEAQVMDPQQRVLLELAYAALEDSGHRAGRDAGKVGVYVGANWNRYRSHCVDSRPDVVASFGEFATALANESDFLATRISHKLDLRGPSATVSTACSTSLVAIVEAARALLNGSCDLALAGGASITVPTMAGYRHEPGGMLSRDGHCKPFDADCSGTTFSDGAAVVVLRRLEDALRDGDQVHAVMRGFAVNNDGADKVSFSAPSLAGQADVLRAAYEHAAVSPSTVGYVEAHGTATPMGDPIEVAALARVFGDGEGACALGSVKSGVGHLVHAAGVTGFLMAAMAVKHGVIPPTLHFQSPNPRLRLERTPFYVSQTARRWDDERGPRRAGVSSFGVGGTNAHVVLEQPPAAAADAAETDAAELICLSAKTPAALDARIAATRAFLAERERGHVALRDVAHTLAVGREPLPHRAAFVLGPNDAGAEWPAPCARRHADRARALVFTFPGLGVERAGMAAALYEHDAAFRDALDECFALARACGGDLEAALLQPDATDAVTDLSVAKPALFAFEYALATSMEARGLRADALLGCSLGEFAAGALAGVFSLRDAIALLIRSGARSAAAPAGRLVTAYCTKAEVDAAGCEGVWVAAEHAPDVLGLAGAPEAVDALAQRLGQSGVRVEPLHGDRAFHSPLMADCAAALERDLAALELRAPTRRLLSASLGRELAEGEATDPGYWARIVSAPIRFARALDHLAAIEDCVLLEVGPGGALTALAMIHPVASGRAPTAALPGAGFGDARAEALRAVGEVWAAGVELR
ncbi:MAG: type I polyketide synthase, partial [Planctomycetota bacterium]